MKPPASIRVGPLQFKVELNGQRSDDANTYGLTDHEKQVILLDPKAGPGQRRVILLHELLHVVFQDVIGAHRGGRSATFRDDDAEEALVTALAPWLLGVLRDNPDLTSFLLAP